MSFLHFRDYVARISTVLPLCDDDMLRSVLRQLTGRGPKVRVAYQRYV